MLILGLVPLPLPEPDFHNIRHHDAPGEVCEHHDHLLRWHPGAGVARDVAVLHWHWYVPTSPGAEPPAEGSAGMALHAHAPAWPGALDDGPQLALGSAIRSVERPAPCPDRPAPTSFVVTTNVTPPLSGTHPPPAFGATFAPGVSLTSLLHRWVC